MAKKHTPFKLSYRLEETLKCENVSLEAKADLASYLVLLNTLSETASKQTHYEKLDEWSGVAYAFIHNMLKRYGFVSGSQEQNDNARFCWKVYGMLSGITYSPNLRTQVASHHSSAFERNAAMMIDVEYLIQHLK